MTDFPISDTGSRMGRPPLKKDIKTISIVVRLPADVLARAEAAAGKNQRTAFIREAIEEKLEREKDKR